MMLKIIFNLVQMPIAIGGLYFFSFGPFKVNVLHSNASDERMKIIRFVFDPIERLNTLKYVT